MKNNFSYTMLILASLLVINGSNNICYGSPFGGDVVIDNEEVAETQKVSENSKSSILTTVGKSVKKTYEAATKKASSIKDAIVNKVGNVKDKISSALNKKDSYINESIFLPGHESKEMVCQGIAYLPSKVMDAKEQVNPGYCRYVLLSYYPKNSSQPSQIVVIDRKTAKPVKRFPLYKSNGNAYTGHAGGIAVAGKYLWVASGNKIFGFSVQDIIDFIGNTTKKASAVKGLPKSLDNLPAKKLTALKTYSVDSKASYVSFDGNYIWVGDFAKGIGSSYSPIKHHKVMGKNAWVAGYLQDQYDTYRKPDNPTPVPTATDDPTAEPTMSDPGPVVCPGDRGDINLDGIVDLTDLSALAIALVDREELKGQANKNADIDKDGEVTLADLARLRQYLSKKTDKL